MIAIQYRSSSPNGNIARALDELARCGFQLKHLEVLAEAEEIDVKLSFNGGVNVSAETYFARIARMPQTVAATITHVTAPREEVTP